LYFYTNFFKKLSLAVEAQKTSRARLETTSERWPKATWKVSWVPSSLAATREQRTAECGEDLLM
jgi:hypothetical protein